MNELVKMVSQKTGIAEDQARTAVMTVLNYLKEKLPGPLAGQLDSVLGPGGRAEDAASGLGNVLNRK
jgi:hypothetical protein